MVNIKRKPRKENFKTVGIFKIFRFADTWDIFCIVLGMLGAIVAGCTFALAFIVYFGTIDVLDRYEFAHTSQDCDNRAICNQTSSKDGICHAIDKELTDNIIQIVTKLCAYAGSIWIAYYILTVSLTTTARRQATRMRTELLKAVLRQDITWYDMNTTTNFTSKMTEDMNKIEDGIGEKLGMLVSCIVAFPLCIILSFAQNWLIALVVVSVAPLLFIFAGLMGEILTRVSRDEMTIYGKAGAIIEDALVSIRTVVAFGGEEKEVQKYASELEAAKRNGIIRSTVTGSTTGLMLATLYGIFGLGFWYGLKIIKDNEQTIDFKSCAATCVLDFHSGAVDIRNCIEDTCRRFSIGSVTIAIFVIVQGGMRLGLSTTFLEAFNGARAAAHPIFEIIDRKSSIDSSSEEGERPNKLEGQISFKNVVFNYPARKDVKILRGFSLDVERGTTVALVGPSGCGKSTCVHLIQRFYDPCHGSLLIDGQDIKKLNIGWVRDHIGVVGQEPVLFDCSIKDNIRYAKPYASDADIERACKEANAYAFIQKLPQNYDTVVGEGGTRLSGGQKQRIAIARALIRNPKILLLDEAASALDTESEALVWEALDRVHKGRTTIIVAHRLSTIRNVDAIVVINEGEVAEKGTHDELMNLNGIYHSLVERQQVGGGIGERPSIGEFTKISESVKLKENLLIHTPEKTSRQLSISLTAAEDLKNVQIKISRMKLLYRLATLNFPEVIYIIVGSIGALAYGCSHSIFAILWGDMMKVFQEPDYDKAMKEARNYALGIVSVGMASFLSTAVQGCMFGISGGNLVERVRIKMFESMLRQEIGWFDRDENSTGALCSRLSSGAQAVLGVTGSNAGQILGGITTLCFGIGVGVYYNWRLGLLASAFMPPLCFGLTVNVRLMLTKTSSLRKALEQASKTSADAISNIRTVAGLRCEDVMVYKHAKSLDEPKSKSIYSNQFRGLILGFSQSITPIIGAVCYYYGCYLITHSCPDELNIKELFTVAVVVPLSGFWASFAFQGLMDFDKAFDAAETVFQLLDRKPNIDTKSQAGLMLSVGHGNIDIVDGEFSYPTRKTEKVLKKLNMSISEGDKIGFVGQSGCGKSTVIQIIQRFYELDNGSLNIGKNDIKNLNVAYVRSKLGIVSQEPVLFNRSIADNIKYGDNTRQVSMEEVMDAAKKSNIHNFVSKLPQGYDTNVGGKGTQLSGGQKQRVAIARAIVR